jgi:hypothetical protein
MQSISPKIKMVKQSENPLFFKACELADVAPTRRQESKFGRRVGTASKFRDQAKMALSRPKENA